MNLCSSLVVSERQEDNPMDEKKIEHLIFPEKTDQLIFVSDFKRFLLIFFVKFKSRNFVEYLIRAKVADTRNCSDKKRIHKAKKSWVPVMQFFLENYKVAAIYSLRIFLYVHRNRVYDIPNNLVICLIFIAIVQDTHMHL